LSLARGPTIGMRALNPCGWQHGSRLSRINTPLASGFTIKAEIAILGFLFKGEGAKPVDHGKPSHGVGHVTPSGFVDRRRRL